MGVRRDPTSRPEYSLRITLRRVEGREIAIFTVDTKAEGSDWRTIVLDRAETPVDEQVWEEWVAIVDGLLETGIARHLGVALQIPGLATVLTMGKE